MKKIISVTLAALMSVGLAAAFTGCNSAPRDEVLKLYLPGEYIDEDIFDDNDTFDNDDAFEFKSDDIFDDDLDGFEDLDDVFGGDDDDIGDSGDKE